MQKTKILNQIEERMENLEPGSLRYQALDCAKRFKHSWIDLGKYLFSISKDKLFRDWGYLTFETYCSKEVGIRKETAGKLLRSYYFLESEEPVFLKRYFEEEPKPTEIPTYEAVNALRLAKTNKSFPEDEYADLRTEVLDNGKEEKEVKQKIRYILKKETENASDKDPEKDKSLFVKKFMGQLAVAKDQMAALRLPGKVVKQVDDLIQALLNIER